MAVGTMLKICVVVVLWLSNATANRDSFDVWCDDDNPNRRHVPALCSSKVEYEYPWTFGESRTAPSPQNGSLEIRPFVYKTGPNATKHIGIRLAWSQKVSHFMGGSLTGYHLEITYKMPPGESSQRVFRWNNTLINKLTEQSKPYVTFHYNCCGNPDNIPVRPGGEYNFKLQAMPIYQETHNPIYLDGDVSVPGCRNRKYKRTKECQTERPGKQEKEKRKRRRKPHDKNDIEITAEGVKGNNGNNGLKNAETLHIILAAVGSAIFVLCLVVFYKIMRRRMCSKRNREQHGTMERSVLLICSSETRFISVNNHIIKSLKKCDNLCVKANLRENLEIGEMGVTEWAEDNINNSDYVVFFPSSSSDLSEGDVEKDVYQFVMQIALKVAKNTAMPKKIDTKKKFLMVDLNDCVPVGKHTFCQHYKLPEDFKKFAKHVVGDPRKLEDKDQKIISSLLSLLQHGYNCQEEDSKQECIIALEQNDLDHVPNPSLPEQEQRMNSLNIVLDGLPSLESNTSYITTDMNYNTGDLARFQQAGARPKVV